MVGAADRYPSMPPITVPTSGPGWLAASGGRGEGGYPFCTICNRSHDPINHPAPNEEAPDAESVGRVPLHNVSQRWVAWKSPGCSFRLNEMLPFGWLSGGLSSQKSRYITIIFIYFIYSHCASFTVLLLPIKPHRHLSNLLLLLNLWRGFARANANCRRTVNSACLWAEMYTIESYKTGDFLNHCFCSEPATAVM